MQDLINMVRGASARLLIAACASIEKEKHEKRRGRREAPSTIAPEV
jgi:hypothetical protein